MSPPSLRDQILLSLRAWRERDDDETLSSVLQHPAATEHAFSEAFALFCVEEMVINPFTPQDTIVSK